MATAFADRLHMVVVGLEERSKIGHREPRCSVESDARSPAEPQALPEDEKWMHRFLLHSVLLGIADGNGIFN